MEKVSLQLAQNIHSGIWEVRYVYFLCCPGWKRLQFENWRQIGKLGKTRSVEISW